MSGPEPTTGGPAGRTAVLPAGTVTFVLSDLEGSTHAWETDREAMAAALEQHDGLLRDVVGRHAGHWLKHTGDGSLSVFQYAHDAVAAAVAMQRALAATDWGTVVLRARVGIHTGEAEEREGDYFGPTLNRLARVTGLAHGGQVVMTLATAQIVEGQLPAGVQLVDLGEHRLRGVDRRQRVFQVVAADLPSTFPPLRDPGTAQGGLPQPRTTFVGRVRDRAAVERLLETRRLVTLTGVGGCGKTRLAIELARDLQEQYPDGVVFADLGPLADPTLVAGEIARAAGLRGGVGLVAAGTDATDDLVGLLGGRRALLVLDNCEHVLDACAAVADVLLSRCPRLRVLATSREPLLLEGEQIWHVGPLSLAGPSSAGPSEALTLLLDRLRAVRPEVADDARAQGALVEICQHLDGIPLALELAAARMAHLSPSEVADRLADRFRLLSVGRRGVERQRTLQAAVDWSHDLLGRDERVLLRRLAVFAGTFDLDAAGGICSPGLDQPVLDVLGSLVDKSLVVASDEDGRTGFRLLETIRLYAEDKLLAAGEAQVLRERHRDWHLTWVEQFRWDLRVVSPHVAARFEARHDDLRLGLEWSLSTGRMDLVARLVCGMTGLFATRFHFEEADRWFAAVLTAPPDALSTELRAEAALCRAMIDTVRWDGDPATFVAAAAQVRESLDVLPAGHRAAAIGWLALAGFQQGISLDSAAMDEEVDQLLSCCRSHPAPLLEVHGHLIRAIARMLEHDLPGALEGVQQARAVPGWGPEHDFGLVALTAASIHHLMGEHQTAVQVSVDALASPWGGSWQHLHRSIAAAASAALGRPLQARNFMVEAWTGVVEAPWRHPNAACDCVLALAAIAYHERRYERASQLLATAAGPGRVRLSLPYLTGVYLHYRDLIRQRLDPDTRARAIAAGRGQRAEDAIEQELARDEQTCRGSGHRDVVR